MPKFHTRLSIIEKKKITFIFILNFFCKIFEINMQIILCNIKKKTQFIQSQNHYIFESKNELWYWYSNESQNLIQERP